VGRAPVAEAPPPTPAAVAFQRAGAERTTRAAAAAEQARLEAAARPTEDETTLAEGEGRAETFGYCTSCHSTALIRRSAFSRQRWDELMDWVSSYHRMNPLEGESRTLIVDYLARHCGEREGQGYTNPFLSN
jgi:hypothetical protein